MAFAALMTHLGALNSDFSNTFNDILDDLLALLSDNLNQKRIFIPTLVTVAKLFEEKDRLRVDESERFPQCMGDT